MLENRLDNSKFSTLECPITDVMAAFGLDFDEQLGPNRRYILTDTRTGRVYDDARFYKEIVISFSIFLSFVVFMIRNKSIILQIPNPPQVISLSTPSPTSPI